MFRIWCVRVWGGFHNPVKNFYSSEVELFFSDARLQMLCLLINHNSISSAIKKYVVITQF